MAEPKAKSWILRCKVGHKRREIGMGAFPDVTLSAARDRARDGRDLIRKGIDPVENRKAITSALIACQKRSLTFSEAMERFLVGKLVEFENEKHRKQWRSTLDKYAVPAVGTMQVSDICVPDVQRILEPIWLTKNETASRLRARAEAVLAWAAVAGHREGENPARWKGNLDAVLPKPGKVQNVIHHPALALDDVSEWFADVRSRNGIAARALELLAMTAARSGEIRGALWSEMDLEAGLWVIPAKRMKMRTEHKIPLTLTAADLLRNLDRLDGGDYVFAAQRGGMLSDAALSGCMRRINMAREGGYLDSRSRRPAVPHGLRSAFRDWAAELTDYPREMSEIQLAHKVGTETERAYRRGNMLEKRRAMLSAWGRFLCGEGTSKIVELVPR